MAARSRANRIMGFSAGGHLAMSASTHFDSGVASAADVIDRAGSRPDFTVLGYPVISMTEPWTHQGSKNSLLGNNADPELAKSLSGELAVTKETPPTFIFQTNADTTAAGGKQLSTTISLCERPACPQRCTSSRRTARSGPGE